VLPVVLCHGLFGYNELSFGPLRHSYWRGIDRALAAAGHPVIVTRANPVGGIARRAMAMKSAILDQLARQRLDDQKIILIGHSMGGLDARYLVSRLGFADRVAAVVTVCTPHRGSSFADYSVRHLDDRLGVLRFIGQMGIDVGAFRDLTTDSCRRFNEDVPDASGVRYFSISAMRARSGMPRWGRFSYNVIYEQEGDNDGLVSVKSAPWGTHLGTWDAHHWQAINRRTRMHGPQTPANIAPFYVDVVGKVTAAL
jgi:triacylglycerol lipase